MIELILFAGVTAWNIITFSLYGIHKHKARNKKWRISESALILCAFLMGGAGALLGMMIFRHKTQNPKFRVLMPLALIVNIGIAILVWHHFEFENVSELWL